MYAQALESNLKVPVVMSSSLQSCTERSEHWTYIPQLRASVCSLLSVTVCPVSQSVSPLDSSSSLFSNYPLSLSLSLSFLCLDPFCISAAKIKDSACGY